MGQGKQDGRRGGGDDHGLELPPRTPSGLRIRSPASHAGMLRSPMPSPYKPDVHGKATVRIHSPLELAFAHARFILVGHLPPGLTMRKQLWRVLETTALGRIWELVQTFFTLLALVDYVVATYSPPEPPSTLDLIVVLVFAFDYVLHWLASEVPLRYPFSISAIADVVTCVPTFVAIAIPAVASLESLQFFRVARILRALRVVRLLRFVYRGTPSATTRELLYLSVMLFSLNFLFAGVFNIVEDGALPVKVALSSLSSPASFDLTGKAASASASFAPLTPRAVSFGNAMYFAFFTQATVGYGDIVPYTPLGRALTSLFILIMVLIIPHYYFKYQLAAATESRYRAPIARGVIAEPQHVILIATSQSLTTLREVLDEFYHDAHLRHASLGAESRRCVILGAEDPSSDLVAYLSKAHLESRVQYVKGSALSAQDLRSAGIAFAGAVFLLSDAPFHSSAHEMQRSDRSAVLRAIMSHTLSSQAHLFVRLLKSDGLEVLAPSILAHDAELQQAPVSPGVSPHVADVQPQQQQPQPQSQVPSPPRTTAAAVVVDEWCSRALVQGALMPGFPVLVSQLLVPHSPPQLPPDDPNAVWLRPYLDGATSRIISVQLPRALAGHSFSFVSAVIQEALVGDATLWGVMTAPKRVERRKTASHFHVWKHAVTAGSSCELDPDPVSHLSTYDLHANNGAGVESPDAASSGLLGTTSGTDVGRGELLFNPGPAYRMGTLERLVLCVNDHVHGRDIDSCVTAYLAAHGTACPDGGGTSTFALDASKPPEPPLEVGGFDPPMGDDHINTHPDTWSWKGNALRVTNARHAVAPLEYTSRSALPPPVAAALEARIRAATPPPPAPPFEELLARLQRFGRVAPELREMDLAVSSKRGSTLTRSLTKTSIKVVEDARLAFGGCGPPAGHVILAGPLSELVRRNLLHSLQSDHASRTSLSRAVVMLVPTLDAEFTYDVRKFIYCSNSVIVQGLPTRPDDLLRAGIVSASALVLVAHDESPERILDGDAALVRRAGIEGGVHALASLGVEGALDDAGAIFQYLKVERARGDAAGVVAGGGGTTRSGLPAAAAQRAALAALDTHIVMELAMPQAIEALDALRRRAQHQTRLRRASVATLHHASVSFDADADESLGAPSPLDRIIAPEWAWREGGGVSQHARGAYGEGVAVLRSMPAVSQPFFAAGHAVLRSSATSMLVSAFYSPIALNTVELLLSPRPTYASRLVAEKLPRALHGVTYGALARHLRLHYRGAVPIALFRTRHAFADRATAQAPMPPLDFFVLSPSHDTVLHSDARGSDIVFALSLQPLWEGAEAMRPTTADVMSAIGAGVAGVKGEAVSRLAVPTMQYGSDWAGATGLDDSDDEEVMSNPLSARGGGT